MGGRELMSFADDLLEQSYHLLNKDGEDPICRARSRLRITPYSIS